MTSARPGTIVQKVSRTILPTNVLPVIIVPMAHSLHYNTHVLSVHLTPTQLRVVKTHVYHAHQENSVDSRAWHPIQGIAKQGGSAQVVLLRPSRM